VASKDAARPSVLEKSTRSGQHCDMKNRISLRIVVAAAALALLAGCAMFQESGQSALVGTWTNSLGTVWAIKADGTFDVDLPLTGNSGIECRSGGANGDYTLVFNFANTVTSIGCVTVTSGTGSVSSSNIDSSDAHSYIVNLTGVSNAQVITVSIDNVTDSAGNFSPAVAGSMGVLLGDVNASGRVDAADVSLVRQQTLQPISSSNFREDVNTSGRIDAADVSIARQQTLTSLPSTP